SRHVQFQRVYEGGWAHVLRDRSNPAVAPRRLLRRQDSKGSQADGSAGRTGDDVRARPQSQDGEGARDRIANIHPIACRRGDRVTRREFITLFGGTAATWPLAARAQQREKMRRIGVLLPFSSDDAESQARMGAFLQTLALSGWTIGRNVQIDTRWGARDAERIQRYAAELVALAPDVILAHGISTVGPLRQASRTVPIVFPVMNDPVGLGVVDSLARPGGNVTGFIVTEFNFSGKWLELLKQVAPDLTRVAVLRDTAIGTGTSQFRRAMCLSPGVPQRADGVN